MTCGIYAITNKTNGKMYIGQSINIEKRITHHFNSLKNNKHHNKELQRSYNKNGKKNFTHRILIKCQEHELNQKEQEQIKKHNTYRQGYNQTIGGDPYSTKVPEVRKKIGDSHRGRRLTEQHKENIRKSHKKTQTHNKTQNRKLNRTVNTTGYYRTSILWNRNYKQGYTYAYRYNENQKPRAITGRTIQELEEKVRQQNKPWHIINPEKAKKTLQGIIPTKRKPKNYIKKATNTYQCIKIINGKKHLGGTYHTEQQAQQAVEKLEQCHWDPKKVPEITKEIMKQ